MAVRWVAALVLGVLGVLALTIAVPSVWTRDHLLDTDSYVSTVRPIAGDPRLQADVIAAVDQQITSRLNVASLVNGTLAATLRSLGSTLQLAVDGFVDSVVTKFVRSTTFADLWVQLNRVAHQQVLALLTTGVTTNGLARVDEQGRVFVDLGVIVARVKQLLIAGGLTIASAVPAVTLLVEVAALHMFHSVRGAVRLTTHAANWLPWIGGGLLLAAVVLASQRRRALAIAALGVVAGMLVVGGALTISRNVYLDAVPRGPLRRDTVRAAYDIVFGSLSNLVRVVLLVALAVTVIAWLIGTSELAVSFAPNRARDARCHRETWAPRGRARRAIVPGRRCRGHRRPRLLDAPDAYRGRHGCRSHRRSAAPVAGRTNRRVTKRWTDAGSARHPAPARPLAQIPRPAWR